MVSRDDLRPVMVDVTMGNGRGCGRSYVVMRTPDHSTYGDVARGGHAGASRSSRRSGPSRDRHTSGGGAGHRSRARLMVSRGDPRSVMVDVTMGNGRGCGRSYVVMRAPDHST